MKRFIISLITAVAIPASVHAQTAHVSVSVWTVPADPAALIENPNLVAQFQSVVDAGADRIYSARLSENGVANITFYPLNDALDGVLEQTAALRAGAGGTGARDGGCRGLRLRRLRRRGLRLRLLRQRKNHKCMKINLIHEDYDYF